MAYEWSEWLEADKLRRHSIPAGSAINILHRIEDYDYDEYFILDSCPNVVAYVDYRFKLEKDYKATSKKLHISDSFSLDLTASPEYSFRIGKYVKKLPKEDNSVILNAVVNMDDGVVKFPSLTNITGVGWSGFSNDGVSYTDIDESIIVDWDTVVEEDTLEEVKI